MERDWLAARLAENVTHMLLRILIAYDVTQNFNHKCLPPFGRRLAAAECSSILKFCSRPFHQRRAPLKQDGTYRYLFSMLG